MTILLAGLPSATQRRTIWLLAACILGVVLAFGTTAMFHPNCQDPAFRQRVLAAARWLPWLLGGMVIGFVRPDRWLTLVFLYFLLTYPLVQYVWMRLAFVGWSDWQHYWIILSSSLPPLVMLWLAVAGSVSGSLLSHDRTRQHAIVIALGAMVSLGVYLVGAIRPAP